MLKSLLSELGSATFSWDIAVAESVNNMANIETKITLFSLYTCIFPISLFLPKGLIYHKLHGN